MIYNTRYMHCFLWYDQSFADIRLVRRLNGAARLDTSQDGDPETQMADKPIDKPVTYEQ
jgi:hypothetical protein